MFIGAINQVVREFLGNVAPVFNDRNVIVGCSGNFTSESVIAKYARPASIHSNDISLYSCMAGAWLTRQPLDFTVALPEYEWLNEFMDTDDRKLASLLVLFDLLEWERQKSVHEIRMWNIYRNAFGALVNKTQSRLSAVSIGIDSYFPGDVFEHFKRFGDDPNAVFCCYAPTYAGGYEKMYARLEQIFAWTPPHYEMLDDAYRDRLLVWMAERKFLWYDDRIIPSLRPVMQQKSGRMRTVYLYSNVVEQTAVFNDRPLHITLPPLPLADAAFRITPSSKVWLEPIKTTDLLKFKDAFLGRAVNFSSGMWAFAIYIDGRVIGFIEFMKGKYDFHEAYLMADFAVPGTIYPRLSKLIVMLAISRDTRKAIERLAMVRKTSVTTTAFTERAVSMKYRGVLELTNRGKDASGKPFLNYAAPFNSLSWQETFSLWQTKHNSPK